MILQVKVKPCAKNSSLAQTNDGLWLATLKSAPVDGKANKELIALIAKQFHCKKSQIHIKTGSASRLKLVEIKTD